MQSSDHLAVSRIMIERAAVSNVALFVVGGVVRDLLAGKEAIDFDIDVVVEGDAISFARDLAGILKGDLKTFPDFLTAKIKTPAAAPGVHEVDFASSRAETYSKPGALPTVRLAPIRNDLMRRDFTVNAMALPLAVFIEHLDSGGHSGEAVANALLDPFHGQEDLKRGLIRVLHERSFLDDPTRLFRACRYAARIGGVLEPETALLAKAALAGGAAGTVSLVRVCNELVKILSESDPRKAVGALRALGVLNEVGPQRLQVEQRAGAALERLAALCARLISPVPIRVLLQLVLVREFSTPPVEPIARTLSLSKREQAEISRLTAAAEKGGEVDELDDAGLLARMLIGDEAPACREALRRGVIRG